MGAVVLADVVVEDASANVSVDTERNAFVSSDSVVASAPAAAVAEVGAPLCADVAAKNATVLVNVDT